MELMTYITFGGNCEEAFSFLRNAFRREDSGIDETRRIAVLVGGSS